MKFSAVFFYSINILKDFYSNLYFGEFFKSLLIRSILIFLVSYAISISSWMVYSEIINVHNLFVEGKDQISWEEIWKSNQMHLNCCYSQTNYLLSSKIQVQLPNLYQAVVMKISSSSALLNFLRRYFI